MSQAKELPKHVPITFVVPPERKLAYERRAAEYGAKIGRPISLSGYIRDVLDAVDSEEAVGVEPRKAAA